MFFLNPAVLLGLLAASIPVLIHLLNLRKLKRIDFSTLAFLKELQKNKIRKIKLKQWLLLALRVMIIVFVVMAFARPALKGTAIGGTTSAAKTTAVFILDDTFSMSVVDNKGSYFNRAIETIKELTAQLQEGDNAALIKISGIGQDEISMTNNITELNGRADAFELSHASGYLHDALIKASRIISASENFNKEIYILSDFQSSRLAASGTVSGLSELLDERVKIYAINFSGKKVFNLSADDLKINTQILEKDKPVSLDLTVSNHSAVPAEDAVISIFINGERSAQQSADIPPGTSVTVSMEAQIKSQGFINLFSELQDDEVNYDNRRFANIYIPEEIPVIIFSENIDDARFISLALSVTGSENPLKVSVKNSRQIYSTDLNQYKAVIIIGEAETGIDKLKSYLAEGGGLFLMPGRESNENNFNKILNELDLPQARGTAGSKKDISKSAIFEKVEYEHPVFQNIFTEGEKTKKENDFRKIESPSVYFHFNLSSQGKGRTIISLNDGSAFLSEYKSGRGKIFLINTAPVLEWSTFPIKSIFVPLINKSVHYLAFQNEENGKYLAGETININLGSIPPAQVKIQRPDNTLEFLKIENGDQFLSYRGTGIAGFYNIFSGEKLLRVLPVNTDPAESELKYLSADEFRNYLKQIKFKGTFVEISKDENPSEKVLQARFGSELWKYALITALVLACAEMALARSSRKEMLTVTA